MGKFDWMIEAAVVVVILLLVGLAASQLPEQMRGAGAIAIMVGALVFLLKALREE